MKNVGIISPSNNVLKFFPNRMKTGIENLNTIDLNPIFSKNTLRENNYTNESIIKENRIVYENDSLKHVIARITTNDYETILDFKNINKEQNDLKISNESLPLKIYNNINEIKSILEILGFYKSANNTRIRYIYEKDDVIFEIDNYIKPKINVIAIEGNKTKVDNIYNELKAIIKEEKL